MKNLAARKVRGWVMIGLCGAALLVALAPLVSLLWLVISRGISGFSWRLVTQLPAPVGEPGGGIGNALLGTGVMVAMASAMGLPLGIGAGVFLAESRQNRFAELIRFTAEVLSGVPSIVIGLVAYALVVVPLGHFSALAGAVALAVLMIPPLARSAEELIRLVPNELREAGLALGIARWKTSLRIVLRTALGGIVTASLLAVARAAGETAPLLFTALNNQYWSVSPKDPMASLTVQIFNDAISPYDAWHQRAWTAALLLLLLVALLNISSRLAIRGQPKARA